MSSRSRTWRWWSFKAPMSYELAIGRNEIFCSISEAKTAYDQFYVVSDDSEAYKKTAGHVEIQLTRIIKATRSDWKYVELSDWRSGYKAARHDRLAYPQLGLCDIKRQIALFKCAMHNHDSVLASFGLGSDRKYVAEVRVVQTVLQAVHCSLGLDEWKLYDAESDEFIEASSVATRLETWLANNPWANRE